MTQSEFEIYIDELLSQGTGFALYRLPGDKAIQLVHQGELTVLDNLNALNKKSGFVIAPFRVSAKTPLVLLTGTQRQLSLPVTEYILPNRLKAMADIEESYKEKFNLFISTLKDNRFDKLVLSRKKVCGRTKNFSVAKAFLMACQWYVQSYVYLCFTPLTGTWLGCSPEIILSGQGQNWQTVALAGTQPLIADELPGTWDEKNRKEQELVSGYIQSQLQTMGIYPVKNGPYAVRAAGLAHLKTDFTFKLPNNDYLGDLLALLHPTPAVCGLPKEKAYQFIAENEGYNRRYYSGFVGMLSGEKATNLYVNLRCMEITKNQLYFYAGGGLLPSSVLEEEWKETEYKLVRSFEL